MQIHLNLVWVRTSGFQRHTLTQTQADYHRLAQRSRLSHILESFSSDTLGARGISRVVRPNTRVAKKLRGELCCLRPKPREKTSGAGRFDLLCSMELDLVSNLSIKRAVSYGDHMPFKPPASLITRLLSSLSNQSVWNIWHLQSKTSRFWMFGNKRGCNWLGAIRGIALWSRGFSRGSLWRLQTGNRAWKASGTQGIAATTATKTSSQNITFRF